MLFCMDVCTSMHLHGHIAQNKGALTLFPLKHAVIIGTTILCNRSHTTHTHTVPTTPVTSSHTHAVPTHSPSDGCVGEGASGGRRERMVYSGSGQNISEPRDGVLVFESRFESGNLHQASQV